MRTFTPGLASVLTIGLLVGSTVGVAAQELDPMAAAIFEVSFDGEPSEVVSPRETEDDQGVRTMRDGLIVGLPVTAGDARASGLMTKAANIDVLGDFTVEASHWRLVNDDGAWAGPGTIVTDFTTDDGPSVNLDAVLTGEGGYEGLTLILSQSSPDTVVGHILPSDRVPPIPDLPTE